LTYPEEYGKVRKNLGETRRQRTCVACTGSFSECASAYEFWAEIVRTGHERAEPYVKEIVEALRRLGFRGEWGNGAFFAYRRATISTIVKPGGIELRDDFAACAANRVVEDHVYRELSYQTARDWVSTLVNEHPRGSASTEVPGGEKLRSLIRGYLDIADIFYVRFRAVAINLIRGRHYFRRVCCDGLLCDQLFCPDVRLAQSEF
jgi:transcriptional regulator NrdR family protein